MSAAAGMVLVAFGAIGCLVGGAFLARTAHRTPRTANIVATALVLAGAAFLIALLASGLRHFGGHDQTGGTACAQWWVQIDSRGGLANDHITPAYDCQRIARAAVGTAVTQSGLIALAWGGLVGGYLTVRRRTVSAG